MLEFCGNYHNRDGQNKSHDQQFETNLNLPTFLQNFELFPPCQEKEVFESRL
jgi:hypothetical protein